MYASTMIDLMYIHPLGSDFLVEGTNVLLRFYASIARLTILGWSPHGLLCKAGTASLHAAIHSFLN
ncbi:hypothetical protein J3A83DRAFT_4271925 [Scleroderma citrinum]